MMKVADLRGDDLGASRAGEEQELIELVRADVAEDASVALPLEEPGRAIPIVWMTVPTAPSPTRRPALTVARFSSRSL
jgi:hypothetical protein